MHHNLSRKLIPDHEESNIFLPKESDHANYKVTMLFWKPEEHYEKPWVQI